MSNGHGGEREGAGRPKKPRYADDGLLTPLDYMLAELRNESNSKAMRLDIAVKAAPYCHARLQHTDLNASGDLTINLVSQLDQPAGD